MDKKDLNEQKLYLTDNIKIARKKYGYTQQQFADVLKWQYDINIGLSMWRKIESGVEPITINRAVAVANVLGMNVVDIAERRK